MQHPQKQKFLKKKEAGLPDFYETYGQNFNTNDHFGHSFRVQHFAKNWLLSKNWLLKNMPNLTNMPNQNYLCQPPLKHASWQHW